MEETFTWGGKAYQLDELKQLRLNRVREHQLARVTEAMKLISGGNILDVGCGMGDITTFIAEQTSATVVGLDINADHVKIARALNASDRISFREGDLFDQHFPDQTFDCVVMLEVIEHLLEPARYLREIHRILRPKGHLVLSTPNATSLYNFVFYLHYWTRGRQRRLAQLVTEGKMGLGEQHEHVYLWDLQTLIRLLMRSDLAYVDHAFTSFHPLELFFRGRSFFMPPFKKTEVKSLIRLLPPLCQTIVLKAQKA